MWVFCTHAYSAIIALSKNFLLNRRYCFHRYIKLLTECVREHLLKIDYSTHKPLQHTRKSFSLFPPFEESLLDLHRRVSRVNRW